MPEIVDRGLVDKVIRIKSDDAIEMVRALSRQNGLMVGISSGANVLGSIRTLDEIGNDKVVVTVLPDRTERYFSMDLYLFHDHLVRRCLPSCQCVFA